MQYSSRWLAAIVLVAVADVTVAGCVGDSPNGATDAGTDATTPDAGIDVGSSDAGADAATSACDITKPFSAPMRLDGLTNTQFHDDGFWLLPDLLTVFASGDRPLDGSVGDFDILTATRSSADAAFGPYAVVAASTNFPDRAPTLTADGRTMYFTRGYSPYQIYVATRSSALVPFGPAALADAPLTGAANDVADWVSQDGTTIYISSDRPGSAGFDIYVAARVSAGFGTPTLVSSLNSPQEDSAVILTPDELQAFVASNRPGGAGALDIYHSSRASKSSGFSTPVLLGELSSPTVDQPVWVSPDGCTLYFTSRDRDSGMGGYDTYVATRAK